MKDNPYLAKSLPPRPNQDMTRTWRDGKISNLLRGLLLYRRVFIEAPVEAEIEFDGWSLWDVVRVDGKIVSSRFSWWRINPELSFELETDRGTVPACVRTKIGRFLRMRKFQIEIDGQVVYQEGKR